MKTGVVFALGMGLAVSGCATMDGEERRVVYACERGADITVVYRGDEARVIEAGGEFILRREPTASGVSYTSGTRSLRGKGDEIIYAIGRMAPMTCQARRPEPR